MASRQQQNTGTTAVREGHRFDAGSLQEHMVSHVEGCRGPLDVEQVEDGQSNPTYLPSDASGRYAQRAD